MLAERGGKSEARRISLIPWEEAAHWDFRGCVQGSEFNRAREISRTVHLCKQGRKQRCMDVDMGLSIMDVPDLPSVCIRRAVILAMYGADWG